MSERVLVTGATGFVGTRLCAHLKAQGYDVYSCDLAPHPDLENYQACDISDEASIKNTLSWAAPLDHVIHLAAMTFGLNGNCQGYLLSGWSLPQLKGTWTMGSDASLLMQLDSNSHCAYELVLNARPFLTHLTPQHNVEVFVNGESIAIWDFDQEDCVEKKAMIAPALIQNQPCTFVRMKFAYAISLKEVGLGLDDKPRALFVENLSLNPLAD